MINFNYVPDIQVVMEERYKKWITTIIISEHKTVGEIEYILCDDNYLININQKFLKHDTYTDIITFDYVEGDRISGDIFISLDRVRENAVTFETSFEDELRRVMAHGILHLVGYRDKGKKEIQVMRKKENEKMRLFHVEH